MTRSIALEDLAKRFIAWWSDPLVHSELETSFSSALRYDIHDGLQDEDALWFIRQKPTWTDLETRITILDDGLIEVAGTGTDPVTNLRMRRRWRLRVSGDQITHVDEWFEIESTPAG